MFFLFNKITHHSAGVMCIIWLTLAGMLDAKKGAAGDAAPM